jgi:hypothetical protein
MIKAFFTLLFLVSNYFLFSQENFCECASYYSLQWKQNELEAVFPPDSIKKNNFKEVIITVMGRERTDTGLSNQITIRKPLIKEYREAKFTFNAMGLATSMTWYNQMGKPHSLYLYERNASGKISKETFYYTDGLGKPDNGILSSVKILRYDASNNLVMIKSMDNSGQEPADNQSQYTQYVYDAKGRITKTTYHYYYDDEGETTTVSNTIYDDTKYTSKENGTTNTLKETTYNKAWLPLEAKLYDGKTKELALTVIKKYDAANHLISHSEINKLFATECPEYNGFYDLYTFSAAGVIGSIVHSFNNRTCEMIFSYTK